VIRDGAPALLDNAVKAYAWGSRTVLAELQGRPAPSAGPEAELWLGAYVQSSSHLLATGEALRERIDAAPTRELGAEVASRYGGKLPFLLKVLAVERPLSLQAHPTVAQAREGFAREEAAGVPRGAPERNYRDEGHKPELLCALTPFEALCGFRDVGATCALLDVLAVPRLEPVAAPLRERGAAGLRPAIEWIMSRDAAEVQALVAALTAGCRTASARSDAFAPELGWLLRLGEAYPGDPGVLSALLLELVRLAPGEAIFTPAGVLHAYLRGAGVEIMASSDNVLRGGLTTKHVDVPELLRVLRCEETPAAALSPTGSPGGEQVYPALVDDFRLSRLVLGGERTVRVEGGRPQILLCTEGSATVRAAAGAVTLPRGSSAWVPAAAARLQVEGQGLVFRATVDVG
jgi:mannose-6-phosphate isomerase